MHSVMFEAREIAKENREHAKANAAYGAQLLEADRRATLRADLMRQRRELKEKLAGVELMLDELDAQDCLDRVS